MKKPVRLDRSYDLYLSMTWMPSWPHGVSGHVYEIIEYYLLLRDHFKVGIMFGDTFANWPEFEKAILDKYNIPNDILRQMQRDTVFHDLPKMIRGTNILFVDGGLKARFQELGVILIFDNIISFKCSCLHTFHDLHYDNVTLLQDRRVYVDKNPQDIPIAIDYKKKIYFKYFKDIEPKKTGTGLLYATRNCRFLDIDDLINIVNYYNFDRYMVITTDPEKYCDVRADNISFHKPVVDNLFERFDTYIHTPLRGAFDCSPRFAAECIYYGKSVEYYNIDDAYLERDTGLKYRKYDIENDFLSIHLDADDDIIHILKGII